jgi:hypothetical protein
LDIINNCRTEQGGVNNNFEADLVFGFCSHKQHINVGQIQYLP